MPAQEINRITYLLRQMAEPGIEARSFCRPRKYCKHSVTEVDYPAVVNILFDKIPGSRSRSASAPRSSGVLLVRHTAL